MTNEKLNQVLEEKLNEFTEAVDEMRKLLRKVENIEIKLFKSELKIDFYNQKRLLEYQTLIGILNLDLITSIRIHQNSKYKFESLFSARQVNVIITEGFKKIYHFKESERKKTFWIQDIGQFIDKELSELKSDMI